MLAARRKTMLFHGIFFAIHWQFPSLDKSGHAMACPDLLLKTITIALVIQDCKNDAYHSITDSTSSQMERTLD